MSQVEFRNLYQRVHEKLYECFTALEIRETMRNRTAKRKSDELLIRFMRQNEPFRFPKDEQS